MEETLEEMDKPDFNMADFNSKEMIVSLLEAGNNISFEMAEEMKNSIKMACDCIMRRNVGPGYTNICITDCFVTVTAGELLCVDEMIKYGRNMLKKFLAYTQSHGEIAEYNSPTYSILTVNDIGDFLRYVKDEKTLEYANEINFMLWQMLAEHFDWNTLQLNGPQERAYSDFINIEALKTIGKACNIDYTKHPKFLKYFDEEQIAKYYEPDRKHPVCPQELVAYFKGEKIWKYVRKMVTDGYNFPWFEFPKVATTYRGERYTIGTYNKSEMWNQRRPFLSYIYNEDGADISFRVKCYHDGFDFSSGTVHMVQNKSEILGSINFSENRGDTHVGIDKITDGLISAEDLRISFEFCGDVKKISYKQADGILLLDVNGVKIRINTFIKEFGDSEVEECIEVEEKLFRYSLIFYSGERKTIDLTKAEKALVAFTVEFEYKDKYTKPISIEEKDVIKTKWKPSEAELYLISPKRTMLFIRNMSEDYEGIGEKDLCTDLFVIKNEEEMK